MPMPTPSHAKRLAALAAAVAGLAALAVLVPVSGINPPAIGQGTGNLPAPPANGVMGFLVARFEMPIIPGLEPCPDGLALTMREQYVASLSPAERERLSRKENEAELTRLWKAEAVGPNGANVCSQPDMFPNRPLIRTVRHPQAWGMDLDHGDRDTCAHEEFTDPHGVKGIDNQEYRARGCLPTVRGKDGLGGEFSRGMGQFMFSGEWTQVLLLKGVDSLQNDPQVEVIYANTPDRPVVDTHGKMMPGATFSISDVPPRHRNVLKGRIVNGVLETEPQEIVLTQTWGQGGARDIRGNRSTFTFKRGRLRLKFQPDGSLSGLIGGYRPIFEEIQSPAIGGVGSALTAGIDCAAELNTLRKLADGVRDPKTGQCTAVSSAVQIDAIPSFVNDVPAARAGGAK